MIGSRRKVLSIYRALEEKAGIPPERFERVYAPIGLAIGALTPEEIAVSIAAELIAVPVEDLLPMPPSMEFAVAAAAPLTFLTAWARPKRWSLFAEKLFSRIFSTPRNIPRLVCYA